mgnify:CR=1 FL=1
MRATVFIAYLVAASCGGHNEKAVSGKGWLALFFSEFYLIAGWCSGDPGLWMCEIGSPVKGVAGSLAFVLNKSAACCLCRTVGHGNDHQAHHGGEQKNKIFHG